VPELKLVNVKVATTTLRTDIPDNRRSHHNKPDIHLPLLKALPLPLPVLTLTLLMAATTITCRCGTQPWRNNKAALKLLLQVKVSSASATVATQARSCEPRLDDCWMISNFSAT
jgi:hypothetical protein